MGAMVTTGGDVSDEEWLLYTRGGGPLLGVAARGLALELPGWEL